MTQNVKKRTRYKHSWGYTQVDGSRKTYL